MRQFQPLSTRKRTGGDRHPVCVDKVDGQVVSENKKGKILASRRVHYFVTGSILRRPSSIETRKLRPGHESVSGPKAFISLPRLELSDVSGLYGTRMILSSLFELAAVIVTVCPYGPSCGGDIFLIA